MHDGSLKLVSDSPGLCVHHIALAGRYVMNEVAYSIIQTELVKIECKAKNRQLKRGFRWTGEKNQSMCLLIIGF